LGAPSLATTGGVSAVSYLALGSETTIGTRVGIAVFDITYQLGKTGHWNPIQTFGTQFGPLTAAISASTVFNINAASPEQIITFNKNASVGSITISTLGSMGGGYMENQAALGNPNIFGIHFATGFLSGIPGIWSDGANEIINNH
jgi:hypothetical protein